MAGKTQEMAKIAKRLSKLGFDAHVDRSGHYAVHHDGQQVRSPNGVPLRLPVSPGSSAAVRSAIARLKQAGISL